MCVCKNIYPRFSSEFRRISQNLAVAVFTCLKLKKSKIKKKLKKKIMG